MGLKRVCREYRSSLAKALHLSPYRLIDGVDQRLHFDRHGIGNGFIELLKMLRSNEEWGKSTILQELIRKNDCGGQIAKLKWPDIEDSRDRQRALLDGMNLTEAIRF